MMDDANGNDKLGNCIYSEQSISGENWSVRASNGSTVGDDEGSSIGAVVADETQLQSNGKSVFSLINTQSQYQFSHYSLIADLSPMAISSTRPKVQLNSKTGRRVQKDTKRLLMKWRISSGPRLLSYKGLKSSSIYFSLSRCRRLPFAIYDVDTKPDLLNYISLSSENDT